MHKMLLLLILFLPALTFCSSRNLSTFPKVSLHSELSVFPKKELIVELAIFYDTGFYQIFQNDPQKIQQYWEVVMYDLHLRFQTLPSFRITFRVTSLSVYKNPESRFLSILGIENHFITEVERRFQIWLYSQRKYIPSFDIAILVISKRSEINLATNAKTMGSICRAQDHTEKKWIASSVISFLTDSSIPELLSRRIAFILGAPYDSDLAFVDICDARYNSDSLCCIMSSESSNPTAKFFSNCTNYHLSQSLISKKQHCIVEATSDQESIIDSAKLFQNPSKLYAYTGVEQCRILLNDNVAQFDTEPKDGQCFEQYCLDQTANKIVYAFTVLEGTRCGHKGRGRCIRGHCIQQKSNLVNVATGKCLVSEKSQFGSNDKPILQNCSSVVTQQLTGKLLHDLFGNDAYTVKVTYSINNGPVEKWLILDKSSTNLKFSHRKDTIGTKWVLEVMSDLHEFVMQSEKFCLKAAEDEVNVVVTKDCSGEDWNTRWRFDLPVTPDEIMNNVDNFYDHGEEEGESILWLQFFTVVYAMVVVVGFYLVFIR